MTPSQRPYEFDARQTAELLDELDRRLRQRRVGAAVFVVGGAAIAATGVRSGRLTLDVDALTRDQEVLDEALRLANERGLPPGWLNPNAKMWMPPLPEGVLDRPDDPGLRVTYADDGFLFATKLVAQRAKDAEDLVALATRLGLLDASPDDLERHLRRYYTNEADLEFIIDGTDVDREITMLCRDAARLLGKARAGNPESHTGVSTEIRFDRGTAEERRQPPTSGDSPRPGPSR